MPGEIGVKTMLPQISLCHFRTFCGMADGGIIILCLTADVMEQTGCDEHICVGFRLMASNVQRQIQDAVDMFLVMGAVLHTGSHILLQLFKNSLLHEFLASEKRAYREPVRTVCYSAWW